MKSRVRLPGDIISRLRLHQKSVSQSGNWRKLAICEDQRAATLVVIVFLMCFVPWRSNPPCAHFSCWSRVGAWVPARMPLHVYSYYLYLWALKLVPWFAAVSVFVLFAGTVRNFQWGRKAKRMREIDNVSARERPRPPCLCRLMFAREWREKER